MKRWYALFILLSTSILLQCAEDDGVTPTPPTPGRCDSLATHWFQEMIGTIAALEGMELGEVRNFDFSALRSGFSQVRSECPGNGLANLGLAICEILELNYSDEIWEVIDSIAAWSGRAGSTGGAAGGRSRNSIIGRQFELLVEVPFAASMKRVIDFPPNVTIGRIQQIVEDIVIPALSDAINLLNRVEQRTDTKLTLTISGEGVEETIVIDLGEIYLFDASLYALRAAFRMAISYDMDFVGPDGTYNWVEDLIMMQERDCAAFDIDPGSGNDTLNIYFMYNYVQAVSDSVFVAVAHHNLENRNGFLTLRGGGDLLELAHQDLLGMIGKLEGSVDFIKNVRAGETEQNVIKLADLTGLESGLGDPNSPNFARDFQTIEDVLAWARDFTGGPVQFTENLGPTQTPFSWTMDMSAMFDSPVSDCKELLPYHRWNLPAGPWISADVEWLWEWENTGGWPVDWYYVYYEGECRYPTFYDIAYIREYGYSFYLGMEGFIELLDGPNGNVINLETERLPYFPDYTINGLFPDMTRTRWLELIDILE